MDMPEDALDNRDAQAVLAMSRSLLALEKISASLAEARQRAPGADGPTPPASKADVMAVLAAVLP
jgi:hypothetical protein